MSILGTFNFGGSGIFNELIIGMSGFLSPSFLVDPGRSFGGSGVFFVAVFEATGGLGVLGFVTPRADSTLSMAFCGIAFTSSTKSSTASRVSSTTSSTACLVCLATLPGVALISSAISVAVSTAASATLPGVALISSTISVAVSTAASATFPGVALISSAIFPGIALISSVVSLTLFLADVTALSTAASMIEVIAFPTATVVPPRVARTRFPNPPSDPPRA
mmetsp:Transcript_118649/g.242510  ORF Transcript_118649/g.242510 Transcript_118649/m.242510 type:complete len:221 (-) Transcript_118649:244-906(-)